MSKNVQVSVVGPDFEEMVVRAVPLIDDFLHEVLMFAKPKADGALVRLLAGVALHNQIHPVHCNAPVALDTSGADPASNIYSCASESCC